MSMLDGPLKPQVARLAIMSPISLWNRSRCMTIAIACDCPLHYVAIQKYLVMRPPYRAWWRRGSRGAQYIPNCLVQAGNVVSILCFPHEYPMLSFSMAMKLCMSGPFAQNCETMQEQTMQTHWMRFLPSLKWIHWMRSLLSWSASRDMRPRFRMQWPTTSLSWSIPDLR